MAGRVVKGPTLSAGAVRAAGTSRADARKAWQRATASQKGGKKDKGDQFLTTLRCLRCDDAPSLRQREEEVAGHRLQSSSSSSSAGGRN